MLCFGSADSKRVTGAFFVSADSVGVSDGGSDANRRRGIQRPDSVGVNAGYVERGVHRED